MQRRIGLGFVMVALVLGLAPAAARAGGLYFRLAAGPGYATGTDKHGDLDGSGGALDISTEIAIGTHLRPHLIVGGGEFSMVVLGPGHHLGAIGPFIAHAHGRVMTQAALVFVPGYHEAKDGLASSVGAGGGAMIGISYDVWRGKRWSVAPLVRVTYYHWQGGDYRLDQVSPTLLLALTHR